MKKISLAIFGSIILFFVFLLALRNQIQTYMSFPSIHINTKEFSGYTKTSLDFEDIYFTNSRHNTIHGLYIDNDAEKTIYYLHGNGGALPYFYSDIEYLKNLGYNVASYDYPGYGKSEGFPDDKEVYSTTEKFFEKLQTEKGLTLSDTIVVGYSVGSAPATDFVSKNKVDKFVLVAPLSSRYDMSEFYFGTIIQKFLFLSDSFENYKKVQKIKTPTLIIHGDKDTIVPYWGGEKVFENSAAEFKDFVTLEGFGHNFIFEKRGDFLQTVFTNFFHSSQKGKLYQILNTNTEKPQNFDHYDERDEKNAPERSDDYKKITKADTSLWKYFGKDDSLQKFVSPDVAFKDKTYIPNDLVSLEVKYIVDVKGNAQMREEAARNLTKMAAAFYEKFGEKMYVVSTYRSYLYQKGIKDRGCPDALCSKAGHSEHQSGLGVDLWEASTYDAFLSKKHLKKYFEWLNLYAADYGFHNSYQKGVTIDGYEKEPWHWRYLGKELALYLNESKLTFSEFYSLKNPDVVK